MISILLICIVIPIFAIVLWVFSQLIEVIIEIFQGCFGFIAIATIIIAILICRLSLAS